MMEMMTVCLVALVLIGVGTLTTDAAQAVYFWMKDKLTATKPGHKPAGG